MLFGVPAGDHLTFAGVAAGFCRGRRRVLGPAYRAVRPTPPAPCGTNEALRQAEDRVAMLIELHKSTRP